MPILNRVVKHLPSPVNQGPYGVCVAATVAGVLEAIEHKQRGIYIPTSIKYIYGNRKDGDFQGEGMVPREALQAASRFGAPRVSLLPGITDYPQSKQAVTPDLDGEGLPYRIRAYVALSTLQDISDYMCLYDLPVVFGMMVTDTFINVPSNGMIPAPGGEMLGGHCMKAVGILNGRLVLQNHWGNTWGDCGVGHLDLKEHPGWEAWGCIPEDTEALVNRPQEAVMRVGSSVMYVDNKPVTLTAAPIVIGGRTMLGMRDLCELLGGKVEFYGQADGKHAIIVRWGGEQEKLEG
jgi:hypothetical protein